MKRLLTTLFLTISLSALFAQDAGFLPGYIITNSSDTIKGFIKYINQVPYRVLQNIKFKQYENADAKQYAPTELLGYKAEEKIFNAVSTNGKESGKKFMELLADGYVKTYRLTISSFGVPKYGPNAHSSDYLLKTGDSKLFEIDNYLWEERVSEYLSDNKILANDVRNGAYKFRDLPEFIKEYNAGHL